MRPGARIRLATPDDGAAIAAIYRPFVTDAATSFELQAPDGAQMAARIAAGLAFAPWLVCTEGPGQSDDVICGYAYAGRHRDRAAYQWSVDVTVYIAPDHHRQGIGRALYQTLFALLRLQGFYVAHAGITLPNPGSVGLHESFGFRPVGIYPAVGWKLGAWRDVGWWQLPLQPRPDRPTAPITPTEAAQTPAWAALLPPR